MFKDNVPKKDLDKFYNNCELHNMSGILCNATAGISNKNQFEIQIFNKNIYVFVSNYNFDPLFITIAIDIIYNIYDNIKIKDSQDNIILDLELFYNIKQEYDTYLKKLHSNLDQISLIVKNMKNESLTQLKQFLTQKKQIVKQNLLVQNIVQNGVQNVIIQQEKNYICDICKKNFVSLYNVKRHKQDVHKSTKN
jgi:hypothetical protein